MMDANEYIDDAIGRTSLYAHLGFKVVEQCNKCHREVPCTVSGTCLDCIVTDITESFSDTG